jgi:hypothetical protein
MFVCPACDEAGATVAGFTEDARTELVCRRCDHRWIHGDAARTAPPRRLATFAEARQAFVAAAEVDAAQRERLAHLRGEFLARRPEPTPDVTNYWARYQRIFSADGLPEASPADLKGFANHSVGAGPGNMSVFNRAWNDAGDAAASAHLREAIEYLLRGPADVPLEDRLNRLIDPADPIGTTGFRESLLTKVLCVTQPERFLPILVYTSAAGGKREIAKAVFGLDLPAPAATGMTRGRLVCWSNDLLVRLVGEGFPSLQHASQFLWWAKDEAA